MVIATINKIYFCNRLRIYASWHLCIYISFVVGLESPTYNRLMFIATINQNNFFCFELIVLTPYRPIVFYPRYDLSFAVGIAMPTYLSCLAS